MSKFRKATRSQAKLRAALIGPAGSGKTYSALSLATNLIPGARVAVIDTECGSAELYASRFAFDTLHLARHSPLDYVDAIRAAESEGYDVVVIDSLSHAWMGRGGALEQVDQHAERDPRGNSYTAWRFVTPKHNQLVEAMLSCRCHLIATMRAKTEYVQEKGPNGKTEIRKIGLAAVQRDGLEYEFTLVGDLDLSNQLKISKTRLDGVIAPGDVFERPGKDLAERIYKWLMEGVEAPPAPAPSAPTNGSSVGVSVESAIEDVFRAYLERLEHAPDLASLERAATGPGKPLPGTPQHAAAKVAYVDRRAALVRESQRQGAAS
jgi:hypothetical protein